MRMTNAERQARYQKKVNALRAQGSKVKCACGCDALIPATNKQGKPALFAHGHNAKVENIGQRFYRGQPAWNKGQPALWARRPPKAPKPAKQRKTRKINTGGYVLIYCPEHPNADQKGFVPEHRLIIERMLGRYLRPTELVHHKNHERQDNREENLMLVTKSEHSRIHGALTGGVTRMTSEEHGKAGRKGALARWGEY